MKNTISIQNRSQLRIPPHKKLHQLSIILLESHGNDKRALELLFLNDRQIRPFYRQYFGENRATDVIAFPMDEPDMVGSIVISVETARRQARIHQQSLWDEIRFLMIHGFLHLLGHDHAKPAEKKVMQSLEQQYLTMSSGL